MVLRPSPALCHSGILIIKWQDADLGKDVSQSSPGQDRHASISIQLDLILPGELSRGSKCGQAIFLVVANVKLFVQASDLKNVVDFRANIGQLEIATGSFHLLVQRD